MDISQYEITKEKSPSGHMRYVVRLAGVRVGSADSLREAKSVARMHAEQSSKNKNK